LCEHEAKFKKPGYPALKTKVTLKVKSAIENIIARQWAYGLYMQISLNNIE
jgi:hypothetical protein